MQVLRCWPLSSRAAAASMIRLLRSPILAFASKPLSGGYQLLWHPSHAYSFLSSFSYFQVDGECPDGTYKDGAQRLFHAAVVFMHMHMPVTPAGILHPCPTSSAALPLPVLPCRQ